MTTVIVCTALSLLCMSIGVVCSVMTQVYWARWRAYMDEMRRISESRNSPPGV